MASVRAVVNDNPYLYTRLIYNCSVNRGWNDVLVKLSCKVKFQSGSWSSVMRAIEDEPTVAAQAKAFVNVVLENNIDAKTFATALREASRGLVAGELEQALEDYLSKRATLAKPVARSLPEKLLGDFFDVSPTLNSKVVAALAKEEGGKSRWELLAIELRAMSFQQDLTDELLEQIKNHNPSRREQAVAFIERFCDFSGSGVRVFSEALALAGEVSLANEIRASSIYPLLSEPTIMEIRAARKNVSAEPAAPASQAPAAASAAPVILGAQNPQDAGRGTPECVVCQDAPSTILLMDKAMTCIHKCVCHACSLKITLCPLCRKEIAHRIAPH